MIRRLNIRLFGFALLAGLCWASLGWAGEPCRIAFDMGSSGIRTGADHSERVERLDLDVLGLLSSDDPAVMQKTAQALINLPQKAGFRQDCVVVAGGFSAWRLAFRENPEKLGRQLAELYRVTGIPLLVIPIAREGHYGRVGAELLVAQQHPDLMPITLLDLGGGSFQVSSATHHYGLELGQKAWFREVQRVLGREGEDWQPLTSAALLDLQILLQHRLSAADPQPEEGGHLLTLSRPVTRAVVPALRQMGFVVDETLRAEDLRRAILQLSGLILDEVVARTGIHLPYARYLVTDMLLVEGLLRHSGADRIAFLDRDLSNIPGLLRDDQAYAWQGRYACYLQRLTLNGLDALATDPGSCP